MFALLVLFLIILSMLLALANVGVPCLIFIIKILCWVLCWVFGTIFVIGILNLLSAIIYGIFPNKLTERLCTPFSLNKLLWVTFFAAMGFGLGVCLLQMLASI